MKRKFRILAFIFIISLASILSSCMTNPINILYDEVVEVLEGFEYFPIRVTSVSYRSANLQFLVYLHLGGREIRDEYIQKIDALLYEYLTSEQFIEFARNHNSRLAGMSDRYIGRRLIRYSDRLGMSLFIQFSNHQGAGIRTSSRQMIINEHGQN